MVDDELGALGLTDAAKRPRAVNGQLLVDDVRADLERRRVAFTDEADAAPGAGALHRADACVSLPGAIERRLSALTVRQLLHRRNHLAVLRVEYDVGAELLRKLKALG